MIPDIRSLSDRELLTLFGGVLEELRGRGTIRSTNNPVADYAEGLCAKGLDLTLATKSTRGYDGIDAYGRRIEIKARRVTPHNSSRQLSAIRGLDDRHFDLLAGVLFDQDFGLVKACLMPYEVVISHSTYVSHSNSWRFLLRDGVWSLPGVMDITHQLRQVQQ
jgi:hypothetical protein